ncbi:hypothetical protein PHAVU_L001950, partial [Phaseolus vulgaris]
MERGTPFFFSNFPFDLKESDLWKIFRRWRRVSDVFISKRLNIKTQRFGFVRFLGVQNVRELENHLNTIWIGSWKLYANRPKYNRTAETRKEWNAKLKEKVLVPEKDTKKVWKAKETSKEWLNNCYIGRVSDLSKISGLNESFVLGGLGYIKIKFLGGFHVLLKGENESKIKDAIEENKEWFEDLFDTIIPWEENFVAVDKLVWVRCRGLPLKLWNYDCFKHIAALMGTLIEVDEATLALEELEYGRFRVRITVGCEAKINSYMKINDVLYQVSVVEECTIPDYKLCFETEVDSISSNASVRSGNRDFEVARTAVEEKSTTDVSMAPPLAVQGCRKTEPDAPSSCCNALVARTIGPISAPILRPVIGSDTPTALSRADVKKRCGLSDLGQCVENK